MDHDAADSSSPSTSPVRLAELGALIEERRIVLGWSKARLARAAGVSRSHVSMVERGKRGASDAVVMSLASILGVDPVTALMRATRDRLPDSLRGAASEPDSLLKCETVRLHLAGGCDYELELSSCSLRIDRSGTIHVVRTFTGCRPVRGQEVRFLEFSESLLEGFEDAPAPRISTLAEPSVPFKTHSDRVGSRSSHQFEFTRPWTRSDDPDDCLSIQFQGRISGAVGAEPRRGARPPGQWYDGIACYEVRHPTARALLTVHFDEEVPAPAEFLEPCGWLGRGLPHIGRRNLGAGESCRSLQLVREERGATLEIESPLPGYAFGIPWTMVRSGGHGE